MKVKYITIEREYGSGGTLIARKLSEQTGIPCYGKEILEAVAKRNKISVDSIEKYEESVSNSLLFTLSMIGKASMGKSDMLTNEGHIFVAEQEEIQRFAKNGKAIFLGHCASKALEDEPDTLHTFIRCKDAAVRKTRIINDYGIPEADVEANIKRFDKKRANYYYANTAKKWNNYSNYDIVADSSVLGIDGCVAMLKSIIDC